MIQMLARSIVAAVVLFISAWLIYGFGAGYFSPVGVPTPLNYLVAGALSFLVVRWAWRLLGVSLRETP